MTVEKETDICERISAGEESIKSAHKRIDRIEKIADSTYKLAQAVENMQEQLMEMNKRVGDIEKRPVKRYDLIISTMITSILGIVIGFLMKGLM